MADPFAVPASMRSLRKASRSADDPTYAPAPTQAAAGSSAYVPGGPLAVNGTEFAPDDQHGPIYRHALTEAHDNRFREYERKAFSAFDPTTDSGDLRSHLMAQQDVGRQAGMWGPQGTMSALGWAPWYEAINAISDKSGHEAVVSARGMGASAPESPKAGLPPGYTEDRYKQEVDQYVAGGKAPKFTESDFRGFPEVNERFNQEVQSRQRAAPSMRSLAKQGGR